MTFSGSCLRCAWFVELLSNDGIDDNGSLLLINRFSHAATHLLAYQYTCSSRQHLVCLTV